MYASPSRHLSKSPLVKTLDDRQHFVRVSLIDQINRPFAIQKAMFRIKPKSGFPRRIKLRKAIDNISKIGNYELSLRMR